jgi:hypothetical protein
MGSCEYHNIAKGDAARGCHHRGDDPMRAAGLFVGPQEKSERSESKVKEVTNMAAKKKAAKKPAAKKKAAKKK